MDALYVILGKETVGTSRLKGYQCTCLHLYALEMVGDKFVRVGNTFSVADITDNLSVSLQVFLNIVAVIQFTLL